MDRKIILIREPKKLSNLIHKNACKNCPSKSGHDPETEDISKWDRSEQLKTVFNCAWRLEKLCKGYCDLMKISQEDINSLQI